MTKKTTKIVFIILMSTLLSLPITPAFAATTPSKKTIEKNTDITPRANLHMTYKAWDANHVMEIVVKYTVSDGTNKIAGVQDCYVTSTMASVTHGYPSYTISPDSSYIIVTCKYTQYGMNNTAVWTITP